MKDKAKGCCTKAEAAEALGVTERTIDRYIKEKGLQAVKMGRRVYIRKDVLREWIDRAHTRGVILPCGTPMEGRDFYTMQEAANALHVTRPAMYYYIKRKGLPRFRAGRMWLIPKDELREWAARNGMRMN